MYSEHFFRSYFLTKETKWFSFFEERKSMNGDTEYQKLLSDSLSSSLFVSPVDKVKVSSFTSAVMAYPDSFHTGPCFANNVKIFLNIYWECLVLRQTSGSPCGVELMWSEVTYRADIDHQRAKRCPIVISLGINYQLLLWKVIVKLSNWALDNVCNLWVFFLPSTRCLSVNYVLHWLSSWRLSKSRDMFLSDHENFCPDLFCHQWKALDPHCLTKCAHHAKSKHQKKVQETFQFG